MRNRQHWDDSSNCWVSRAVRLVLADPRHPAQVMKPWRWFHSLAAW